MKQLTLLTQGRSCLPSLACPAVNNPVCRMALGVLRSWIPARAEGGLRGFVRHFFWSRGHASVEGASCGGPPDETGCLLSYRQLISGCRRVRYPLTMDALSLSHDVRSLCPERSELMRGPPWKSLGIFRRATNKGKAGSAKPVTE